MKNKLGEDVNLLKVGLFLAFVALLIFGLIAVFVLHSHILAFIVIPLFFLFFIVFLVIQYREVKSGKFQNKMDKLLENTKEKYGRK